VITTAAVLERPGAPFAVVDVELASPGPGEVRVRIEASGVCRSDWNAASGASATALPAVLGHEGSGIVEETGPRVSTVRPGDMVVLSWLPFCGECPACLRGEPSLCQAAAADIAAGTLPGDAVRLSRGGTPLYHYSCLSTFARHAVVPARCCVPVPPDTGPEVAALVGCAVTTGIGAVIHRARAGPGSRAAVFGAGGVGLSVIMGCRLAGAAEIIVVEPLAARRALALDVGATVAVEAAGPDTAAALLARCPGGVDYAFETAGVPGLVELAFSVTRPGGTVVAVGIPPDGSMVSLPGPELARSERVVTGTFYGSCRPAVDMPMILRLHAQGRLPLDRLAGRRYPLEEINDAFADLRAGESARAIVKPWG
jgi:S-(hydroxymethyl)glutathione dehydrogenase/alcohol dehydrogenase